MHFMTTQNAAAAGTSYFGTDGIRGPANGKLTPGLALAVGTIVGHMFHRGNDKNLVIIAKDTRRSGYMIENALTAGLLAAGMEVSLVGPLPTPALAMLIASYNADLGIMITASHNAFGDNGIKIFGPDSYKLTDEQERQIEREIHADLSKFLVTGREIGRARRIDDAQGRYAEFAKHTLPRRTSLGGLRVIVDCANGAAYKVGPDVLRELGAEVFSIGVEPNGFNINENCGSTAPGALQRMVKDTRADIGIAFDGDADRLIVVDERGEVIKGDQILALIAHNWKQTGRLRPDRLVTTVMSNLALDRYLETLGIETLRTKVGDRYVLEKMRQEGINLGGEESGHIIMSDYTTTGDGLISALQLLHVLAESRKEGKRLSEIAHRFEPFPYRTENIRYKRGANPLENEQVKEAVSDGLQKIGEKGLIVRPSGTEPLIRILVQAENPAYVDEVLTNIKLAVEAAV